MITFADAAKMLGNKPRKKIDHNTYLERLLNDDFGVRLYDTVVVEIKADGSYRLNTGGHKTVTTKDRINKFGPVRVHAKQGVWYVGDKEFRGFMSIEPSNNFLNDNVAGLCRGMLQDGNYSRMAILADALQDSGYDNESILNECRTVGDNAYEARKLINRIMA